MKRCVIIRNPASRRQLRSEQVEAAAGMLRAAGWDVTTAITEQAGHATVIAREAAAQLVDVVVVNGGDGTINEAVNGLLRTESALAVLPGGTANVWAREVRIPRDPAKAMRLVLDGRRATVDVGVVGGRAFLLMAGIGLDAAIIPRVNARFKRRWGTLAYIAAGVVTAIRTRSTAARVVLDGAAVETPLYWMLAGNTRNYGGLVDLTHHALVDDGVLDVAIMREGGWRLLTDGVRVLLRRHERSANVLYRQAAEVVVETEGLPVQVDGEPCGETPVRIGVEARALTVIVPGGRRLPSFAGGWKSQGRPDAGEGEGGGMLGV